MEAVGKKIAEFKAQGKSKDEIFLALLQSGEKADEINKAWEAGDGDTEVGRADTRQRTVTAVLTIGSILVGVGIFSFIAANWQAMTSAAKIMIIVVSMIVAYAGGWVLINNERQMTGNALILLGCFIYGGGIFLIGQIFHIRANWPDGFVLWMLGVLPLGLWMKSYPILFVATGAGIAAVAAHPTMTFSPDRQDYLLTSMWLIGAAAVGSYLALRKINKDMEGEN